MAAKKKTAKKAIQTQYNKGYVDGYKNGEASGEWNMYEEIRQALMADLRVCGVPSDRPAVLMQQVFEVITSVMTKKS